MRLSRLVRVETGRRPLALVVLAALCLLGAAGTCLALALADRLVEAGLAALTGSTTERSLTVRPRPVQGALLSIERTVLSEADLAFLRGLPGVERVHAIGGVPIPASFELTIPGMKAERKNLTLYCLDDDAVPPGLLAAWRADVPVPLLFNPRIVTYYNYGLADRYNTPRLSPEALANLTVPLAIGTDTWQQMPDRLPPQKGRIIGFSDDVPLWGAGVPRRLADAWLRVLHPLRPPAGTGAVVAVLRCDSLDSVVAAAAAVRARGLPLEGETNLAEGVLRVRRGLRLAGLGLLILVALVLAAGTASLAAAVVAERRQALALHRSLGARYHHLLAVIGLPLVGAAAIGALAGALISRPLADPLARPLVTGILGGADLPGAASVPAWWALPAAGLAALIAAGAVLPVLALALRRPWLADLDGG